MYHNMYKHVSPCVECQGGCHGVSGRVPWCVRECAMVCQGVCHGVSEPAWITACCTSGPGWLTSNPGLPVDDANNYLILLDVYFSYLVFLFCFF